MSEFFSFENAVITVDGVRITGFENAQDGITITQSNDDGDLTAGTKGDAVFIDSCNRITTVTMKILQHTYANEFLMDMRNNQINNPRTAKSFDISYIDLRNGDEIHLTDCWFTTKPVHSRGTAHNGYTWTFKAVKSNDKLRGGR